MELEINYMMSEKEYLKKNREFFEELEERMFLTILLNQGEVDYYSLVLVKDKAMPVPVFLNHVGLMNAACYEDALIVFLEEHEIGFIILDKKDWDGQEIDCVQSLTALGTIAALQRAIKLDPVSPVAWRSLGLAFDRNRDRHNAINAFKMAVELDPTEQSLLLLGRAFLAIENYGAAVTTFQRIINLYPLKPNIDALNELGLGYTFLGNDSKALEAFEKAFEEAFSQNSEDQGVWLTIQYGFSTHNVWDKAFEAAKKVAELDFNFKNAMVWEALLVASEKVVKTNPNALNDALEKIWEAHEKNCNAFILRKVFKCGTQYYPKTELIWLMFGQAHLESYARHDDAIEAFDRAVALAPKSKVAWRKLGLAYALKAHYDGIRYWENAIEAFDKALQLDPKDHEIMLDLGRCFLRIDNWDSAAAVLEDAAELSPDNDHFATWIDVGYAYKKIFEPEKAKEAFKKAYSLHKEKVNSFWGKRPRMKEAQSFICRIASRDRVTSRFIHLHNDGPQIRLHEMISKCDFISDVLSGGVFEAIGRAKERRRG